jgi:hypothetical protein
MKNMEYFEKDGKLWFSYTEKISLPTKAHAAAWRTFESSGKIPDNIQKQGKEAIKRYTAKKIKRDVAKQIDKAEKQDKFAANPNFPLSIGGYDGKTLKGRIISAEDSVLRVKLEEPFVGEDSVMYNFASAIQGKYIFSDLEKFSRDAIETANKLLVQIYKREKYREKNKEAIKLAEQMNETVPCYGEGGGEK